MQYKLSDTQGLFCAALDSITVGAAILRTMASSGMHLDTDLQLRLRALRGEWGPIAKHADVSISWVSKFTRGLIPNPGIHTLRKLVIAIETLGLSRKAKKPAVKTKPRARRAAVPAKLRRLHKGQPDSASRADGRQKPPLPSGAAIAPVLPPPVAISATPDASNRHQYPEGPTPQHVLKAEGASPEATDRGEGHTQPGRRPYGHLASRRRGPIGGER